MKPGLAGALLWAACSLPVAPAWASEPQAGCGATALGTARVLTLPRAGAAYGRPQHAPRPTLAPGEVVLSFDDGPHPLATPRVLQALAAHCARGWEGP